MNAVRKILVEGEDLSVPANIRDAMGLKPGDAVLLELHGDELRIKPELSALRRLQAKLAPHRPQEGEPQVSDELIADRRAEAARE